MKKYVLDASAVLCGKDIVAGAEIYVPPSVAEELGRGKYRRKLENLVGILITVVGPDKESREIIKEEANKTGDLLRLSNADIDVLALALDLKATILTDDYSIQNVAKHMGIEYQPIAEAGIKEEFQWEYVCMGCRRRFEEPLKECPICGAEVKTKRRKK
ncbi:MAG: PIN domain-containing protein [Thermoplasmata archaeon]